MKKHLKLSEEILSFGFEDNDFVEIQYSILKELYDNQGKDTKSTVYTEDRKYKTISLILALAIVIAAIFGYTGLFAEVMMVLMTSVISASLLLAYKRIGQSTEEGNPKIAQESNREDEEMSEKDKHKYKTAMAMLRQVAK
jgi:hypothetical protein